MVTGNSKGVSVLYIDNTVSFEIRNRLIDVNNKYILLDIVINKQKYLLGNYYGPDIDSSDHVKECLNLLNPREGQEVVTPGNFNLIIASPLTS